MNKIGTPLKPSAKKVLFLGGGELGKEVVIELQRFGVETIVVDRYKDAPAMQVSHRSHVISMLDPDALREIIKKEKPDLIVPEIEAIATEVLKEFEEQGTTVIPTAKATVLTMNREGIRCLAAEELKIPTSNYHFADSEQQFVSAVNEIGMPCVVKPVMSSSGKGQSVIKTKDDILKSWQYAQDGGRAGKGKVIIESFIDFDYEITLLTVRHSGGTSFCDPIGHIQVSGDYRESWQPCPMSELALQNSKDVAKKITDALGGYGVFGVELFIKGDDVYFSEVSPRPHDTGLVTLISQDLSQFALHARAVLGIPIVSINQLGSSASAALLVEGESNDITFSGLEQALSLPDTSLRLFGKPSVSGSRRMGVALAKGESIEVARDKARRVRDLVGVGL